ncbi:hypothetical protein D9M68_475330 [compost metagenome]|uniref:hypothetical protein n=1 Tax=Cupriavidus necator TaxID=106590 RepID=UPI0028BCA6F5
MSVIRSLLAKQDAEFISLRALLEQMASEGGATIQEAAIFLNGLFESVERQEDGWTPPWYKRKSVGWEWTGSKSWDPARVELSRIAETGEMTDVIPF